MRRAHDFERSPRSDRRPCARSSGARVHSNGRRRPAGGVRSGGHRTPSHSPSALAISTTSYARADAVGGRSARPAIQGDTSCRIWRNAGRVPISSVHTTSQRVTERLELLAKLVQHLRRSEARIVGIVADEQDGKGRSSQRRIRAIVTSRAKRSSYSSRPARAEGRARGPIAGQPGGDLDQRRHVAGRRERDARMTAPRRTR